MSTNEKADAWGRFLSRLKMAGEAGIESGHWDAEHITAFCLSDADYIALDADARDLQQRREEERYKQCLAYMETTRPYWAGLDSISLAMAQKCWEREAREKFGYSYSEWSTPCYTGSGMPPLSRKREATA